MLSAAECKFHHVYSTRLALCLCSIKPTSEDLLATSVQTAHIADMHLCLSSRSPQSQYEIYVDRPKDSESHGEGRGLREMCVEKCLGRSYTHYFTQQLASNFRYHSPKLLIVFLDNYSSCVGHNEDRPPCLASKMSRAERCIGSCLSAVP